MGFEESVASITLEDVKDFYYTWIRPGSSSLSVVGDLSMDEIHSMLDARLAEWTGSSIPIQPDAVVTLPSSKILYLMHKPEVEQTVIMAGYLIAPYGELSEIAKEPLINVLGGDFTSRINLNLREDKHWTYGAGVFIREAKGPRPFITYTQVQIDKTKESIQEIIKEYDWIVGEKPLTFAEFEKTKNNQVMSLPGIWETNAAVAGSLNQLIKYQLADDYWSTYSDQVKSLSLEEVQSLGHQLIDSSKLMWFLVSNKDIILEDMKSLGFDRIIIVDSDGTTMDTIV